MAVLMSVSTGMRVTLEYEHAIGRSPRSALRIDELMVSAQHASLRWTGQRWELKDLGSHNGTLLDGERMQPRRSHALVKGSKVAFGDPAQQWELIDDSPPRAMVLALDGGTSLVCETDLLGIPSAGDAPNDEDPKGTLYRGGDGQWRLERSDAPTIVLDDQQTFEVGNRAWRFSCPALVVSTLPIPTQPAVGDVVLEFLVSRDEEHVEVKLTRGSETISLGARGHNYLLLTLARIRIEDAKRDLPDTTCGWADQEQLISDLATSISLLNLDIFRIRQQFATTGVSDSANVIERRPRAKQLRIGVRALRETRL